MTLKAGITPIVYVYTSGRVLFRIPEGAKIEREIWDFTEVTSDADIARGWAATVYLSTDKHVNAAAALAELAYKTITG